MWGRLVRTAACCALGATALAATLTVDDDGPADYASIQAAINAATGGDTILVKPGQYHETVNFLNKAITVTSEAGPLDTVIYLEGETRIVRLNGDATLSGFTIRGGRARIGGGIWVTEGAAPVIADNVIEDNVAEWNGVLPGFGGGIAIDLASSPVITRNVIRNNSALGDPSGTYGYGGGIDIGDYTTATITDNVFSGNTATDSGGAISAGVNGTPVVITNNTLVGNRAGVDGDTIVSEGGGIVVSAGFTGDVRNNVFRGNVADTGGAIYFFSNGTQGITYLKNDFDGNVPDGCAGLTGTKCTTGQLFVPPLFLDAASENYRLRSDSALIDAGDAAGVSALDADSRPRSADGDLDGTAVPDVGAYENARELTRLRFDGKSALAWDAGPTAAVTFDLYRDDLALVGPGPVGVCLQPGLTSPSATDATVPGSGAGFVYLVAGRAAVRGSLGYDSAGAERTAASICP